MGGGPPFSLTRASLGSSARCARPWDETTPQLWYKILCQVLPCHAADVVPVDFVSILGGESDGLVKEVHATAGPYFRFNQPLRNQVLHRGETNRAVGCRHHPQSPDVTGVMLTDRIDPQLKVRACPQPALSLEPPSLQDSDDQETLPNEVDVPRDVLSARVDLDRGSAYDDDVGRGFLRQKGPQPEVSLAATPCFGEDSAELVRVQFVARFERTEVGAPAFARTSSFSRRRRTAVAVSGRPGVNLDRSRGIRELL